VLGSAQADALGAVLSCSLGVPRIVGVRPNLQPPNVVGPCQYLSELFLFRKVGSNRLDRALEDLSGGAVDADDLSLTDRLPGRGHLSFGYIDPKRLNPRYAGLPHAPRDHRRVAGRSTAGRQNAFGRDHPMHVVR